MSDAFEYDMAGFIPFRDRDVCKRVRAIKRADLCDHPNPNFRMSIVEGFDEIQLDYALDLTSTIKQAAHEGRPLALLLPASISPYAAPMINAMGISCKHVHTFNMDEYADQDGRSAPASWPFSFQKKVWDNFFGRIDEKLRPPENQIHFPSSDNIDDYASMIEDAGGIDVVFSQIGWNGHIAYIEPELGRDYVDDIEAYKQLGPITVELSPMTIMQNSVMFVKCGDWSWHPPKAVTVGPAQFVQAGRQSWRQWGYLGNDVSWQRFIVRLAAHGPVTPLVPGSLLQEMADVDFKILGDVADDCASAAE